jgi:hypothetical protein
VIAANAPAKRIGVVPKAFPLFPFQN